MAETIKYGHALDLIADMGPFDLLVTDPPYAFGNQGTDEQATSAAVACVLREAAYRLKKDRWAVIFAAASWRSTAYMIESVRSVLEPVRIATWAKPKARTKVGAVGWAWASVNVILLRKGRPSTKKGIVASLDYIIEAPMKNGRRAQVPWGVAYWATAPFTVEGGIALDPFAGSGALLRPAREAGMMTVGFELNPPT